MRTKLKLPAMSGDSQINELLSRDPIAEAERAIGISYKECDAVTWLGMAIMQDLKKDKVSMLTFAGDVHFNMNLDSYKATIERLGFRQVLCLDIPAIDTDKGDKFYIYWCDDSGLLLEFDTYFGDTSVNGGTLYFQWEPNSDIVNYGALEGCSYNFGKGVFVGSMDCREGIAHKLGKLHAQGKFLAKWMCKGWLWLLHYQDTKIKGYNHDKITASRVAMLPQEVREAIKT